MLSELWLRIAACHDGTGRCNDELPPVGGIDVSSVVADAQSLTGYAVGALIALRIVAAVAGMLVVVGGARSGR